MKITSITLHETIFHNCFLLQKAKGEPYVRTYENFSLVSLLEELVTVAEYLEVVVPEVILHLRGVQPRQPVIQVTQPEHALVVFTTTTAPY